jgi:hypothetical protein
MFDDVTLRLLPGGADAYAGYVNGIFANFNALAAKFPGARLLDISVFAGGDATCLDVENGDATIAQVFPWFKRQVARGVYRPVVYTQASNLAQLHATMTANGFARGDYRVWSAHYGKGKHICGPNAFGAGKSCGFDFGGGSPDGTQWTSSALGRSLDQSLLADNFFAKAPVPVPVDPGKATQPTHVSAKRRWTNATVYWYGAQNVTEGYWIDLVDAKTGVHLAHAEFASCRDSGSFTFHHLKPWHKYKIGVYARPGAAGSHSKWIEVTTR